MNAAPPRLSGHDRPDTFVPCEVKYRQDLQSVAPTENRRAGLCRRSSHAGAAGGNGGAGADYQIPGDVMMTDTTQADARDDCLAPGDRVQIDPAQAERYVQPWRDRIKRGLFGTVERQRLGASTIAVKLDMPRRAKYPTDWFWTDVRRDELIRVEVET